MSNKKKCPDCGGSGGFDYEESASCNHMNTRRTWRPCQTCNLRAFGLEDEEIAAPVKDSTHD